MDDLSLAFSALGDPTRRAILERLRTGQASVSDLAEPFGMSLPAITKHIQVLERAGLIVKVKEGQRRQCHLVPEALEPVSTWIEMHKKSWDDALDRLDTYLLNMKGETTNE